MHADTVLRNHRRDTLNAFYPTYGRVVSLDKSLKSVVDKIVYTNCRNCTQIDTWGNLNL